MICIKNHNVIGMKLATQRFTYAIGKKNKHGVYKNWVESVADYKIWQIQNHWNQNVSYADYLENREYSLTKNRYQLLTLFPKPQN